MFKKKLSFDLSALARQERIELFFGNKDKDFFQVINYGEVEYFGEKYPLKAFMIGPPDNFSPLITIVGGVHGLEVVGAEVVLSYLESLLFQLNWDKALLNDLKNMRMIFIPALNPFGIKKAKRSNGNGIDLMRNAPIDSLESSGWFLPAGHRISPHLPWYRGKKNGRLEKEAQFLVDLCLEKSKGAPLFISFDVHSGFGILDRLWYPFAHTKSNFNHINEMDKLTNIINHSLPNHVYQIESQSKSYLTHGDLWDYIYLEYLKENSGIYLPLTLEMGSWAWVKKNPSQFFDRRGPFNPFLDHRHKRVMRRHILLIDLLRRVVRNKDALI